MRITLIIFAWYVLTGTLTSFYIAIRIFGKDLPSIFVKFFERLNPSSLYNERKRTMREFYLAQLHQIKNLEVLVNNKITETQDIEKLFRLTFLKNAVKEVKEFFEWCVKEPQLAMPEQVVKRCNYLSKEILLGWEEIRK